MAHGPAAARARTLAVLAAAATLAVGCTGTPDDVPTTTAAEKPVQRPALSAPTRGVLPAQAVISAPGTSGTLTVTVRSVDVSPGATVVTWAMRWDDPDRSASARSPVGYFYDSDAKTPTLVDRTAMQVHFPLCPGGSWTGDDPARCGYDGLYSPNGHDSIRLTNHQTLEAWAVFSEVGPDTKTVDLTMPAGLVTPDGVLAFSELPVTRDPPPEPEQPEPEPPAGPATPDPAVSAPPGTPAPAPDVPVEVTIDAPGVSGTLTVTVDQVAAFDTATVVTWSVRWDNPDKPDSDYQEMAPAVHNRFTFVPLLQDRPAAQVYLPLCSVNGWRSGDRKAPVTDLTNCTHAGLFAPNDRDRADGLRLVNHRTVEGWAAFPPVGPQTTTVDLALPHALPAFFALPVTRTAGAPTTGGLVDVQVTDEMRSQATSTLDPAGTVFGLARTDGTTTALSTDLLFEADLSDLTQTAQTALEGVAGPIPQGAAVTVAGYTDSIMDDDVNLPLSRARAQAVADALAALRPDLTLTVTGYGSASPVAANSGRNGTDRPVGRQLNRRVTLTY